MYVKVYIIPYLLPIFKVPNLNLLILFLFDKMLLIKLTLYQRYNSDDFELIIDNLENMNAHIEKEADNIAVREETVAAYVHEMTVLGDLNHPRLWALIGVYHENLYDVLKDISNGTIDNDRTNLRQDG